MRPRLLTLAAAAVILLATLLLDAIIFGHILYWPANRSGWDSFRWYNFAHAIRRLEREGRYADQRRAPRVIVVGSSVAQYSLQADLLEPQLRERAGVDFDLQILSHAAMMPSDLHNYLPRLRRAKPDLLVWIINPADFDLERYQPPWEASYGYNRRAEAHYRSIRLPMKIFYPAAFALSSEASTLGLIERSSLLLRSSLQALRMRGEWYDPIAFSRRAARRPGEMRSYIYYQGIAIPERLWREGHSGARFTVPLAPIESGLFFELPEPLFAAAAEQQIELKLTLRAFVIDPASGRADWREPRELEYALDRSGWQRWELAGELSGGGDRPLAGIGEFRLSHLLNADGELVEVKSTTPLYAGRGVRLPGDFGLSEPRQNDYYVRRAALEDLRLYDLSRSDYRRDFVERVHPDDWRAAHNHHLRQFNTLRLSKYLTNWYPEADLPQIDEMEQLLSKLPRDLPVLLINNPENPLTRAAYGAEWYESYLERLRDVVRQRSGLYLAELQEELPERYFLDDHHLTSEGVVAMSPRYAALMIDVIRLAISEAGHNP